MTEDLQELIEHIRSTNEVALRKLIAIFDIASLVDRFHALESCDDPAIQWALPRAKATVIHQLKWVGNEKHSYSFIGELLGLSAQRVHQLANPEPRRSINGRNTNRNSTTV